MARTSTKKAKGAKKPAAKKKKTAAKKKTTAKKGKFSHGKFLADAGKLGTSVHNEAEKLINSVSSAVGHGTAMLGAIITLKDHFEANAGNLTSMSIEEKEAVLTGIIQTIGEVLENVGSVFDTK